VIETLEEEIRTLRSLFWSDRDPDGRGFAPLADAYRRAGDVKQALELLTEGLDRHPGFCTAHVVAARLYVEQGMHAEAELAARKVLDLDPENTDALATMARALEEQGRESDAVDFRERLAALDPEAEAPAEESEPAEAEAEVFDMGALAPDEPDEAEAEAEAEVFDMGALAPDEPDEAEAEAEAEAEVFDMGALAPDEPDEVEAEAEVFDMGALAPDEPEEAEPEAEVFDMGALAPDEPAEPEPEVVDLGALAPDGPAPDDDEPPQPAAPIFTRTMADLYARQGLVERAVEVYRHLLAEDPDDTEVAERLAELTAPEEESGEPAPAKEPAEETTVAPDEEVETIARDLAEAGGQEHEVDTPFAWTEHEAGEEGPVEGPTMGDFFGDLLAWKPGAGSEDS
jgi:tetratricopeptide (TPR) repeat protein